MQGISLRSCWLLRQASARWNYCFSRAGLQVVKEMRNIKWLCLLNAMLIHSLRHLTADTVTLMSFIHIPLCYARLCNLDDADFAFQQEVKRNRGRSVSSLFQFSGFRSVDWLPVRPHPHRMKITWSAFRIGHSVCPRRSFHLPVKMAFEPRTVREAKMWWWGILLEVQFFKTVLLSNSHWKLFNSFIITVQF
jgi:hypothetical protein